MQDSEKTPSCAAPLDLGALPIRERIWHIIFRSDTVAGKRFDIALLVLIGLSVVTVILESVQSLHVRFTTQFAILEWTFTALFTVEYLVRLYVVRDRIRYARSFFGVVDILSVLPSYLELFFAGSHYFMVIRIFRLLRMFRVLKMAHHIGEANIILNALVASRRKLAVFVSTVLAVVCVEGTMVYLVESPYNDDFSNIPQAIYWAIVTITTVGYGDVAPITVLGKAMASAIMLTGFAIIAVPTGVVSAEINREFFAQNRDTRKCTECGYVGHERGARFCARCGTGLPSV